MKNEIDRLYLIDRYLKGELTGLHLDEFRTKMRLEPDFAKEVESHRAIVEGIKLARKEHLKAILSGEIKIKEVKVSESEKVKVEKPADPPKVKDPKDAPQKKTIPLIPLTKEVKESTSQKEENIFKTSKVIEKTFDEKKTSSKPLPINHNNWYYAAAAVLFAGFFLYFIFGYYIPKEKNIAISDKDSSNIAQQETLSKDSNILSPKTEKNKIVQENPITLKDTLPDLVIDETPMIDEEQDSFKVATDVKLRDKRYMVPSFERVSKKDTQNINNNVNSTNPNKSKPDIKFSLAKTEGINLKIEYWNSVVGFKGYRLDGILLQLFDVEESENIGFIRIDNELYMKRAGSVYRLRDSGNFEQYKKVNDPDLLNLIQNN